MVRRLPARSLRPGALLTASYPGSATVAPDRVRLRVGKRPARLRRTRARIDAGGRLTLAGTIARRARGSVHVRIGYVVDGVGVRVLRYRAPVRRGAWSLRALLPSQVARDGGQMSIAYLGSPRAGVRGEQLLQALTRPSPRSP